jgi:hypothetical protein
MQEQANFSGTSAPKCNDTTNESIPNILEEKAKRSSKSGKRIRSKQPGSGTNGSNANTDTRNDPPPYFLVTELRGLTFSHAGSLYHADDTSNSGMVAWTTLVERWANVRDVIDWENLEDRAHFLNTLYAFCLQNNLTFPLQKTPPKN